jgi:manganese transport protein
MEQGRGEGGPSRRRTGPGWLVAAAFIGPGTVTTATVAGARFGTTLLWALVFSTLATIALQEMSARLGLVSGGGLGEAIRRRFSGGPGRFLAVMLVVSAIGVGNAAYQTGNLLGAALGIQAAVGGEVRWWALGVALAAAVLLLSGSYRVLQRVLGALVAVMSLGFLFTALAVRPPLGELFRGALIPILPPDGLLLALGLVGTTVVPYNLFLHAAAVREQWSGPGDLGVARRDLLLSILVGGAVSGAILVTAAGTLSGGSGVVTSATDMALALEPVLGWWGRALFALGLFAAGLTSAVTAPLAAGWAVSGAMGWRVDLRAPAVRTIQMGVLLVGAGFAATGIRPVPAILFAQAANGILLPAVAIFLLLAVNDARTMGDFRNRVWSNLVGMVVVGITLILGARGVLQALGLL